MTENNLDSIEGLIEHKRILEKSKFLHFVYVDFYRKIKEAGLLNPIVEIGSGAGFIKKIIPKAITTDVIKIDDIDKVVYAEKLPFKKNSLGSIVMLNVFHHIKDPVKALTEFKRTLRTNGKIVMIEPWGTPFSKFIYQNFHHEGFDPTASWKTKGKGRMSDANGAIPWIVFNRDKNKFNKMFPDLKITSIKPHTPFKYLFSGGLSKPQLLPTPLYSMLDKFEKFLSPLNKYFAMFATIEIVKLNTHVHSVH